MPTVVCTNGSKHVGPFDATNTAGGLLRGRRAGLKEDFAFSTALLTLDRHRILITSDTTFYTND